MNIHLKKLVYSLIEWIEEHLQDNLNINMVSKKSGYSKRYIQNVFKDIIGMPIGEYIRVRRLTKSAMLVMFTRKKIEHIASELSYSSLQAFTRAFADYFNYPPLIFRKRDVLDCSKLLPNKAIIIDEVNQEILVNKIFIIKGTFIGHKETLINSISIRKRILRMKEIMKYKKNRKDTSVYIISFLKPYSKNKWVLNVSSIIGTFENHGELTIKFKKCVKIEYRGTWDLYPKMSRNIFNILNLNVYPYNIVEEIEFYCTGSDFIKINIYIEIQ
ncbi:helix-turn-helix domain-containing protein [Salmonella enterica subsp. enterica]|nr:helix-turn-helix domain-containing protein [Salmonella enterica subsp. enterica serovar Stanleyville]